MVLVFKILKLRIVFLFFEFKLVDLNEVGYFYLLINGVLLVELGKGKRYKGMLGMKYMS